MRMKERPGNIISELALSTSEGLLSKVARSDSNRTRWIRTSRGLKMRHNSESFLWSSSLSEAMVSVVIPARNEEEKLPFCLEALRCQSLRDFEIIVADNGSTDVTFSNVPDYFSFFVRKGEV